MTLVEPKLRRWTRNEYYQMGDMGFFEDQRVELIDGEIVEMALQKDTHAAGVSLAHRALWTVFGNGYWVRMQLPLLLPEDSEPEPDVSVVTGSERNYIGTGHPRSALLIVEVSEATLRFDRGRKAMLYASAGINDYWIVNLIDRRLEVYRDPAANPSSPTDFEYRDQRILGSGESIAPLAMPNSPVLVTDLLPWPVRMLSSGESLRERSCRAQVLLPACHDMRR